MFSFSMTACFHFQTTTNYSCAIVAELIIHWCQSSIPWPFRPRKRPRLRLGCLLQVTRVMFCEGLRVRVWDDVYVRLPHGRGFGRFSRQNLPVSYSQTPHKKLTPAICRCFLSPWPPPCFHSSDSQLFVRSRCRTYSQPPHRKTLFIEGWSSFRPSLYLMLYLMESMDDDLFVVAIHIRYIMERIDMNQNCQSCCERHGHNWTW